MPPISSLQDCKAAHLQDTQNCRSIACHGRAVRMMPLVGVGPVEPIREESTHPQRLGGRTSPWSAMPQGSSGWMR